MKKYIYVFSFIVLGILLQFFVHAGIEIWYIDLLTVDFEKYGLGFSWYTWFLIHHIFTFVLLVLGTYGGWLQGRYWWQRIYATHYEEL